MLAAFRILIAVMFLGNLATVGRAQGPEGGIVELIISIPEQRLMVVRDGAQVAKYPVSTSQFGVGDRFGSYRTPLGRLQVCEKIGDDLPSGAVLKHRAATGEVLPVNAPGRDPIVSRIIWLEGLEGQNANARSRGIYIHGTTEESKLGKPVSWGCIRMRSRDVIELFGQVDIGACVQIWDESLPRLPKWRPGSEGPLLAATDRREKARSSLPPERVSPRFGPRFSGYAGALPHGSGAFRGSILFAGLSNSEGGRVGPSAGTLVPLQKVQANWPEAGTFGFSEAAARGRMEEVELLGCGEAWNLWMGPFVAKGGGLEFGNEPGEEREGLFSQLSDEAPKEGEQALGPARNIRALP